MTIKETYVGFYVLSSLENPPTYILYGHYADYWRSERKPIGTFKKLDGLARKIAETKRDGVFEIEITGHWIDRVFVGKPHHEAQVFFGRKEYKKPAETDDKRSLAPYEFRILARELRKALKGRK